MRSSSSTPWKGSCRARPNTTPSSPPISAPSSGSATTATGKKSTPSIFSPCWEPPSRVHILYPRKSEDGQECERSRFIERIVYEVEKKTGRAPQAVTPALPFSIRAAELKKVKKNQAVREQAGSTGPVPVIAGGVRQMPAAVLFQQDPRPEGTGRGRRRNRRRPDRHHRPRGAGRFLRQIHCTPGDGRRPGTKPWMPTWKDSCPRPSASSTSTRAKGWSGSAPGPCWSSCACSSARTGSGWQQNGIQVEKRGRKIDALSSSSPRDGGPGHASRAGSTAAKRRGTCCASSTTRQAPSISRPGSV